MPGPLIAQGSQTPESVEGLVKKHYTVLEQALASLKPEEDLEPPVPEPAPPGAAARAETAVPLERLQQINEGLQTAPPGFVFHKKLERASERRKSILNNPAERSIDWAAAEELAFASILADGVPIRLTGEDVERGTFSQRHAVFHDADTGQRFVPLQTFPQASAAFEIHNSPLSEAGVVGFEFGYNIQEPDRLVIWEAQYGDFINGAQVIIDQFVTSGRSKVGTPAVARVSAPARPRRPGTRSIRAHGPSASCSRRPTSTCASSTARPRRSTFICSAGRQRCFAGIRCR